SNLTASDGSEVWLMDSEGFFGPGVDEGYDAKVFTVATLVGAHVVYNTVKVIDQQAVGLLEMLVQRAQLFRTRSAASTSGQEAPDFLRTEGFPPMTWVVEDFVQELPDRFREEGSTGWLRTYLEGSKWPSGVVPAGSDLPVSASRALTSHGWSAFNVPLIWSAASPDSTDAVVEWMQTACTGSGDRFEVDGVILSAGQSVRAAWLALRSAMRELVLQTAAATHGGVLVLDALYVSITLHIGRHPQIVTPASRARPPAQPRAARLPAPRLPSRGSTPVHSGSPAPVRPPRASAPAASQCGDLWALRGPSTWPAWNSATLDFLSWIAPGVPTFRRVPPSQQARFARVTQSIANAVYTAPDAAAAESAFLLLLGHHRLLLAAPVRVRLPQQYPQARAARMQLGQEQCGIVESRLDLFERGEWEQLLLVVASLAADSVPVLRDSAPADDEEAADLELGRVLQLIRAGELRRAVDRLCSLGLAQGSAEELAQALRSKFVVGAFPQAEPLDVLFPLGCRAARTPTLDLESFIVALRTAPRKTGADSSGSRLEHWQVLLSDEAALQSVHRVLDDLTRGAVPGGRLGRAATGFLLGLLTPLAKPDGGVRPIAAPQTLRRLLSRSVAHQFKDRFGDCLAPLQCAVGLPGGGEVAHKTVTAFAAAHPTHVFFKLDARNAYNSQWRKSSVTQASQDLPELAGLWSLCYCRGDVRSKYLFRRGSEQFWIESDAGVDQGDGLAPALFSFGMKRPSEALLQHLRHLSNALAADQPVLVLLYLDDVVIAVPPALVPLVLPAASAAFGPGLGGAPGAGLELEPTKTEAWCPTGLRPVSLPLGVKWKATGFVFLGSAVHDLPVMRGLIDAGLVVGAAADFNAPALHWASAAAACSSLADRVLALYRRRSEIGIAQGEAILNAGQCVQLVLRFCLEPKLLHLLRSTPPDLLTGAVGPVDSLLQSVLAEIGGISRFLPDTSVQAALPVRDGGCGIGSLALKHHAAFLGSWALCLQPVLARLPRADATSLQLALVSDDRSHPVACHILSASAALVAAGVTPDRVPCWEACSAESQSKQQHSLSKCVAAAVRNDLLSRVAAPDAARIRSCGGTGAGAFLFAPASEAAGTELLDGVLQFSLRWRLGAASSTAGLRCQIGCHARNGEPCGALVDRLGDHVAVCKYGGYKTIRRSRLVRLLRTILRESGASVSGREVEVPAWQRPDGARARLDIAFVVDGARTFVDLTVRHPRALKYVARAAFSDGVASQVAEAAKRERYPASAADGLLVAEPFCIESFGRLGPASLRLLHAARQRAVERDSNLRGWAGVASFSRWLALLSCELQRALFEASQAMWGSTGRLAAEEPEWQSLVAAALPFAGRAS
ncbi:unnamed protein product, partial [Polarella glacialis]